MRIANPIYDVVFKYLMEDKESAIILLSNIIDEEIVDIDFLPKERTFPLEHDQRCLTVYRIDFSAKIKLPDNSYKQVIIEIQKAKLTTDIMRFRRYLGQQYREKENFYISGKDGAKKAFPLITVYFLGYKLNSIAAPIIKVKRGYYDAVTGEKIQEFEEFIESLTHDSFVIQISRLRQPYRSRLEQILSIFDQNLTIESGHVLEINESGYPEQYRALIRRLIRAGAEKEVRETMDAEDDILEELQERERRIEEKDIALEERDKALEEKDRDLEQNRKALKQNKKALKQNKKDLEQKDRALEQKHKALEEKDKIIKELMNKLELHDKVREI